MYWDNFWVLRALVYLPTINSLANNSLEFVQLMFLCIRNYHLHRLADLHYIPLQGEPLEGEEFELILHLCQSNLLGDFAESKLTSIQISWP